MCMKSSIIFGRVDDIFFLSVYVVIAVHENTFVSTECMFENIVCIE